MVVSLRDSGKLLQRSLGAGLDISTAYHPQTDGQTLYGRKCCSPVVWAKVSESLMIRPEIVQETTDKIFQIKDRLKVARGHQKSYADNRQKPLEFCVGDHLLLKVSTWKGVVCFGEKGKLALRFVGPFKIAERIGLVAHHLKLPQELSGVHDTFHVSNLKKCLADETLHVSLEEIRIDAKLHFIEDPVEIIDQEIKKLKHSSISMSRSDGTRSEDLNWEQGDHMRLKYPHLFEDGPVPK
ncbi:hypothetical protein Tco_1287505 [Tanacetum coccineum]